MDNVSLTAMTDKDNIYTGLIENGQSIYNRTLLSIKGFI